MEKMKGEAPEIITDSFVSGPNWFTKVLGF
jgi:hypothetical protein